MPDPSAAAPIEPGLSGRLEHVVDTTQVTTHFPGPGKFSTPSMISLMELASHSAVAAKLPAGHTSVGFEVNVRHLAPAVLGDTVVATAELTEANGRKLTFKVACHHGETLLGEGTHRRVVIPVPSE
jgi:fluoroacetyl-CoA thioesterase